MESPRVFRLPAAVSSERERAMAEIRTAIDLVVSGAARRVTIQGLDELEAVAASALAEAQARRVEFAIRRNPEERPHVVVGPRSR